MFDDAKGKVLFRMGIERPHDAAHVDALLLGFQRHRAGDRGLQRDGFARAGLEPDRQTEIGNADVLDGLLCPTDQAGRAVLQVRQGVFIGGIGAELGRVVARQHRIALPDQSPCLRVQGHNLGLGRARRPKAQRGQSGLGLGAAGTGVFVGQVQVHGSVLSVRAAGCRQCHQEYGRRGCPDQSPAGGFPQDLQSRKPCPR